MSKEKTKIVGYRVKKIHVKSLNEHVRKFLRSKGYKLYSKRKNKKVYSIKGTVDRIKQPNS